MPPEGIKKEQKESQPKYAFSLYSDFTVPELGETKALGRILDEEVYIHYDYDNDGPIKDRPLFWIGSPRGWRTIDSAEPQRVWEAFEETVKNQLFWDAMNNGGGKQGTSYWWQKYINGRQPGSQAWKDLSGNPPEIKGSERI